MQVNWIASIQFFLHTAHSFTYSIALAFLIFFVFFFCRKELKACIILAPLLGLTWVFGLLTATDAELVFQYIFTILNSTQVGVIIMLGAHKEPLYRVQRLGVDLSPGRFHFRTSLKGPLSQ